MSLTSTFYAKGQEGSNTFQFSGEHFTLPLEFTSYADLAKLWAPQFEAILSKHPTHYLHKPIVLTVEDVLVYANAQLGGVPVKEVKDEPKPVEEIVEGPIPLLAAPNSNSSDEEVVEEATKIVSIPVKKSKKAN